VAAAARRRARPDEGGSPAANAASHKEVNGPRGRLWDREPFQFSVPMKVLTVIAGATSGIVRAARVLVLDGLRQFGSHPHLQPMSARETKDPLGCLRASEPVT
jgi:hypothetical protein